MRVLDIFLQDFELVRLSSEDLDLRLELVVVRVDGIFLLGRLLGPGIVALEKAVRHLDLKETVQHVNLALEMKC